GNEKPLGKESARTQTSETRIKYCRRNAAMAIDRRRFLMGLTGAAILPRAAMSRQSASGITKLTNTLSLVTGVGTNVLALSTSDGMVLVDSGAPQYSSALTASTSRVRTVFNTHFHLENTGSNEALGGAGAKILAHENTRQWVADPYLVPPP